MVVATIRHPETRMFEFSGSLTQQRMKQSKAQAINNLWCVGRKGVRKQGERAKDEGVLYR